MTTAQGNILIKKLDTLIMVMSENTSAWVDTYGALIKLRLKNPRNMKFIREHHLKPEDYKKQGKYFEYKLTALVMLRAKMDSNEIIIPK